MEKFLPYINTGLIMFGVIMGFITLKVALDSLRESVSTLVKVSNNHETRISTIEGRCDAIIDRERERDWHRRREE